MAASALVFRASLLQEVADGLALMPVGVLAARCALDRARRVAAACLEEGTDFAQPFRDMDADGMY